MLELQKTPENRYFFVLKSEEGHSLLKSITFSSKKEAKQMAQMLLGLNTKSQTFERKTNHEGRFLFNLKDFQGELIASSNLYHSEAGMENGIRNLALQIEKSGNHKLGNTL